MARKVIAGSRLAAVSRAALTFVPFAEWIGLIFILPFPQRVGSLLDFESQRLRPDQRQQQSRLEGQARALYIWKDADPAKESLPDFTGGYRLPGFVPTTLGPGKVSDLGVARCAGHPYSVHTAPR